MRSRPTPAENFSPWNAGSRPSASADLHTMVGKRGDSRRLETRGSSYRVKYDKLIVLDKKDRVPFVLK